MWFDKLTTLRKLEGRIISFIDQPFPPDILSGELSSVAATRRMCKEQAA
jgi:hypothetical protein